MNASLFCFIESLSLFIKRRGYTPKEHKRIQTFSTVSKNFDCSLHWCSMRKYIWECKKVANTSGPEIILLNCSLHLADPNYVGIFLVHPRMPLIFTDFPTGSGYKLCVVLEICKYQRHPWVYWKNSNVVWICQTQTTIKNYYFLARCTEEELLYNFYLNVTHWASVSVIADSEANCSSLNLHTQPMLHEWHCHTVLKKSNEIIHIFLNHWFFFNAPNVCESISWITFISNTKFS